MDIPRLLLDLAIILFATKLLGLLMRKIGLPQVVGAVLAGLLIGPAIWGQFGWWSPIQPTENSSFFLNGIAEIGVVMILFSAGLETDLKELKSSGLKSTLIALAGVTVPIACGFLIAVPFFGGFKALNNTDTLLETIFIGVILSATSVGITVETLKEMGKLKGKIGTTILSAAIIDDVIGIVVLSVMIGIKDTSKNPVMTIVMTLAFFAAAIVVGIGINFLFKWLSKKYPNKRRLPIFGLVLCFLYAFLAEKVFGIADITGAYVAGITLCSIKDSHYIDRKIDINSYMLFSPVFFANIGISTDFSGFTLKLFLFGLAFAAVGVLSKIGGCAGMAKLLKFNGRDSVKIGIGMIARGEVALVICKKGMESGFFANSDINPIVPTIMLVIISSLLAPMLLKLAFKGEPKSVEISGGAALLGGGTAYETSSGSMAVGGTMIGGERVFEVNPSANAGDGGSGNGASNGVSNGGDAES